jgi:hypothetical protein
MTVRRPPHPCSTASPSCWLSAGQGTALRPVHIAMSSQPIPAPGSSALRSSARRFLALQAARTLLPSTKLLNAAPIKNDKSP